MSKILCYVVAAVLLSGVWARADETPAFPKPTKEHEWLRKFVGEWEAKSEATMGPGQPAMKCAGTMKSRMLGGFWVVSDVQTDGMGMAVSAIQTIGYDPKSKKYVGTWVDSVLDHLWRYTGDVDETGKILTLEAEGPNFLKEGERAKFRDIYEFRTADLIVTTSQMQSDGKWISFMTGEMRRVK